ncbi:uncharacterized protein A1O9_06539 [Exophiala aquamarina CBS 119918]|uniref:Cytochrome P450 oxidoreductase n=1 Tax=Exophiala aquamarina CBS 119918 TaxID=1182545 RepID=A0A072PH28_9EURO|nr:uncharacterized protein A1O9_06539 [Exophiala aquamarina CBS 119918]KEF58613.1 hypothetical protein A1O9_06539 [Exophiala aquamarina CBS 119918]
MVNERTTLQKENKSIPRHVTERGIVDEMLNPVFAGTDTTGNKLTYLFYEMARHPEWKMRLHEELKRVVGDTASPEYNVIEKLPVLEAVVQEIFRLRPAAPDALMRVTPEGGAVVDGVFVPGGITVSCQALSTQRSPTIFPDPDHLQRWLNASPKALDLMREQMLLFGKGARSCLGRRIAIMEIKCALTAVSRRYKVDIGSETTDDDMQMIDHFVLIPKGQRCVLKITKL